VRIFCYSLSLLSAVSGSVSILLITYRYVFGGVVGCVVDGGVGCCWFSVYVDFCFGGVFDNRQVKKIDNVVVFMYGCELQGGVYAVDVVRDCFWRYCLVSCIISMSWRYLV
jgi:hypothetical protein